MKTYGRVEYSSIILGPSTDWRELSASRPRERAHGTHWIGGWVSPITILYAVRYRKVSYLCRKSNPGIQSVAFAMSTELPRLQWHTDHLIITVTFICHLKIHSICSILNSSHVSTCFGLWKSQTSRLIQANKHNMSSKHSFGWGTWSITLKGWTETGGGGVENRSLVACLDQIHKT
jgi:hypothetical protein